jgi:hypothetical protein
MLAPTGRRRRPSAAGKAQRPAETVTYGYNPLGYPTTLSGTDTTGSHPYVTGTGYTALGQLGQRSYGDPGPGQLTRSYTWDPATGRLAAITSRLPNPAQPGQYLTVQNDIYSYTPTGDISAIKDGSLPDPHTSAYARPPATPRAPDSSSDCPR